MAKMKTRTKVIILIAVLAVVVIGIAIALVSCGGTSPEERLQAMAEMMNSVNMTASELERVDLTNTVSVSGNVRSASMKKVYLEATGAGKAQQVNVKVGDTVKVGDVLCMFDTETLQKEYDKLKLQADQNAERAQISLQTAENSYSTGKITQDQAVRAAQDNVELMEDQLEIANDAYIEAVDAYNKGELEYTLETDYNYVMATYNYNTAKSELHTYLTLQTKAEADLGNIENDPDATQEVIDAAKATKALVDGQVESAKKKVEEADEVVDAARKLFESKEIDAESVLDEYKEAVANAEEALANAQKRLEETEKQRKLSLSTASGNIDNAEIGTDMTLMEMNLEDAMENIEKCTITAPVAGTVTAVYATEGEASQIGSILFIIEDLSDLEIKTTVKEYDVASIEVGMPVQIKSDATGTSVYEGKVEEIGVTAQKDPYGNTINSSTAEFDLTISVKPGDGKLKVGMNARANITIAGKQDVLAVLYSAVAYEEDGRAYVFAVRKDEDGNSIAKKVYVETGVESDYEIEILSDELTEGDRIVDHPEGIVDGQQLAYIG